MREVLKLWKQKPEALLKHFDKNGDFAKAGQLNLELFNSLIKKDIFIESAPPKSTGREYYGESFLTELLNKYDHVSKEDWLNTATRFTAYAIYRNYTKFVEKRWN